MLHRTITQFQMIYDILYFKLRTYDFCLQKKKELNGSSDASCKTYVLHRVKIEIWKISEIDQFVYKTLVYLIMPYWVVVYLFNCVIEFYDTSIETNNMLLLNFVKLVFFLLLSTAKAIVGPLRLGFILYYFLNLKGMRETFYPK